jgi:DNA-binding transcriptional MerR regulator
MLRAWDRLGLFRPVWVDPATGYRFYSPAQLPELRRILALRDVGVPLSEIAQLISGGRDLHTVLDRRRAALEEERRAVERRLRALDISLAASGRHAGRGARGLAADVVVRPVAAELVAAYAVDPGAGDLGPAFYALEAYVRDRGRRAARPPGALTGPDGSVEVYVPVTGPVPASGAIESRRLPTVRVASLIHRGSYGSLGAARRALDDWIVAAGFRPAGPLRILYLQFGAEPELRVPSGYVVERDADFVTELQQPVEEADRATPGR